jgi:hypothetical protein
MASLMNIVRPEHGKKHSVETRGSELFNSVKCITLNFTNSTSDGATGTFSSSCYATVNIAHPVKEIIIKQIGWCDNANNPPGSDDIGLMFSDLVNGGFIGSFNASNGGVINTSTNTYYAIPHYTMYQNVRHIYHVPKNIQGSYQFTIQNTFGTPFAAGGRTLAQAFVVAEFIGSTGVVEDVSV